MNQAKIRATGASTRVSAKEFVIHGEVLEGSVVPGMQAALPSGNADPLVVDVDGVEHVGHGRERPFEVALTFRYLAEERLPLFQRLARKGAILTLTQVPRFPCPCCGFHTLDTEPPGSYALCAVCFWEDDGVQFDDPDYAGGANHVSLNEARAHFRRFGTCDPRFAPHVRPPRPDEHPPRS